MFGLGAGELLIIAVVILLALGPDKLPDAAKKIGAGIRDLKKQTRTLQNTIERDTEIGDAVRDLKYAMRGEDPPMRPPRPRPMPTPVTEAQASAEPETEQAAAEPAADPDAPKPVQGDGSAHG